MGDERTFMEIYPALVDVAVSARDHPVATTAQPMNTGQTKILANAIVGNVWRKLKGVPDNEPEA